MGQRALCCCAPVPPSASPSSELKRITQPLRLSAPPAALLAPPTRRLLRSSNSSARLAALVRTSPLSARLPPAALIAVYERALYLCHLPAEHLAWKEYQTSSTSSTATSTPSVYYSSLHTAETTWTPPPTYTPLTPADYHLQPTLDWFPHLSALAASLDLSIRFHDDTVALTDSYYQQLITAQSPSLPNLLYTLPLLSFVLSTYPSSFYRRLPLHSVVLCERLRYKGVEWRCVPVLTAGRMYISCERVDAVYLQSTLHHELFHFIDHSLQPTAPPTASPLRNHIAHPDPEWCALNVPSFVYGSGGMAVRDASASSVASSPCVGLLNAYAASAVEEDRAEVWGALMRDVTAVCSGAADEIVRQKAALLRGRVERWSGGSLGKRWWDGVALRAFSHEARQRRSAKRGGPSRHRTSRHIEEGRQGRGTVDER